MSVFFTSDTHFGHANIIKYSKRPYKNVDEMNEDLITKWNSVVKEQDTVYHVGDIFFSKKEQAWAIRKRLNGNICLIRGNHDQVADQNSQMFGWIKDYYELHVSGYPGIVLCHYAFRVWKNSHHGWWNLYGHSHGSLPDDKNALSFDVGVDCHNYTPLSIEQVKEIMEKKNYKPIDHHGK